MRNAPFTEHAVIVAGGGPTGLMLAGELALAGVDVATVERRLDQELTGRRAGGLHARTIEVFDQRGIADRFLSQGQAMQVTGFSLIPLDISDFPTRHNYGLALRQKQIERIMAEWVAGLPVTFYRGREVTGLAQDDTGVDVTLSDGTSLRAKYLIGFDGGRSVVRNQAGIDFPGWDATTSYLIAEVEMTDEPAWGVRRGEKGVNALRKLEDGTRVGAVLVEECVGKTDEPTLDDVRDALVAVYPTETGGFSWRATRRTSTLLWADKDSTLASMTRSISDGSSRRWSRAYRPRPSSIPTTPSGTPSAPACSA
jgi:2-polyprenyl-6-methoxyphenol hydroxylase-like FAD-dependent oxidoreductase